jgi:spermidine/putrescine-binding protein
VRACTEVFDPFYSQHAIKVTATKVVSNAEAEGAMEVIEDYFFDVVETNEEEGKC